MAVTLTAQRLREVLDYNPGTGIFVWRVRPADCVHIGDVAGGPNERGYWRIRVDGRRYRASRLAWLYMTGAWPRAGIDHWDRVPGNNAWINLREANQVQNGANRGLAKNNTSGMKGVHRYNENKWIVKFRAKGVYHYLGIFECAGAAQAAYALAAAKQSGEFARVR